ncbi:uncharacterized protein [Procambarus clarkii]
MEKREEMIWSCGSWMVMMMMMVVVGNGKAEMMVAPESPFCTQHVTFLTCDFKGADETVVLDDVKPVTGKEVNRIFVHNVQELIIIGNVCVHLAIYNVASVNFSTTIICQQPDLSLKLEKSATNLVPSYIAHLDLVGSSAQKIVCHNDLKFLSVMNSNLGVLNIIRPLHDVTVKFEDSVIDVLAGLKLQSKSQLLMINVTINTLGKNSIHLLEASANIWISNVRSSLDQAITLGPKSTLSIKDVYGKVTFAGSHDINDKIALVEPQDQNSKVSSRGHRGVLPQPSHNDHSPYRQCSNYSHLMWFLPSLLALAEAFIIIINCTNWFPDLKSRRHRQGVEEGARGVVTNKGEGVSYPDSACFFNSETAVPLQGNIRQRVNEKNV